MNCCTENHGDSLIRCSIFYNNLKCIVYLTVIAAVVSTVFVVNESLLYGDVIAKYFWFASAMCACSLMMPFFFIAKKIEIHVADILFCAFAAYVCFNYFFLNGQADMRWWLSLLMFPLYFYFRGVLSNCKENKKFRNYLLSLLLVIFLFNAILGLAQLYGFVQSYHVLYSITGTFFNPGPYSGFLSIGAPLALGFSIDKTLPRWKRWLGFVCLVAILLVLPASMSRASWIAAVAGCFVVLLQVYSFKFTRLASTIIVIVGVCIGVGLLVGTYMLKKDSADGRILLWSASMEAVKENPLFGAGYGRFASIYGDAQATYFLKHERSLPQIMTADSIEYAFNEYVQITVELGIIGLLLFLLLVGSVFRFFKNGGMAMIIKRIGVVPVDEEEGNCEGYWYVSASLISFLVFAAFSYPFSVLPLSILFVILMALLSSSSKKLSIAIPVWLRVAFITVCCSITVYSAYQILSKRESYYNWTVLNLQKSNAIEETLEKYSALYPLLRQDKLFLFEYGRILSIAGQHAESNRIFEKYLLYGSDPMAYNYTGYNYKELGEYEKAENMYIYALQIVPNRFFPLYMLMMLYLETGYEENAKIVARIILEKPVKVQSLEIQQMQEEARIVLSDIK